MFACVRVSRAFVLSWCCVFVLSCLRISCVRVLVKSCYRVFVCSCVRVFVFSCVGKVLLKGGVVLSFPPSSFDNGYQHRTNMAPTSTNNETNVAHGVARGT